MGEHTRRAASPDNQPLTPEAPEAFRWRNWLAPKHWPTWSGIVLLWLLSRLPYDLSLRFGRGLGSLLFRIMHKRRTITIRNLEIAFPEHPNQWHRTLALTVFRGLGMSIAETAWSWFRSMSAIDDRFEIEGEEHLRAALNDPQGVIVLQAHFSCMELIGAWLGPRYPIAAVYDNPKNPLIADLLYRRRRRNIGQLIENTHIRVMASLLRQGGAVWYSPDQSVSVRQGGIETTFFDQAVLTTPGTARLATLGRARVLPMVPLRLDNGQRYRLRFSAPLTLNWKDVEGSTNAVNALFEAQAREYPEQYFWVHKRFKAPPGHPDPYRPVSAAT